MQQFEQNRAAGQARESEVSARGQRMGPQVAATRVLSQQRIGTHLLPSKFELTVVPCHNSPQKLSVILDPLGSVRLSGDLPLSGLASQRYVARASGRDLAVFELDFSFSSQSVKLQGVSGFKPSKRAQEFVVTAVEEWIKQRFGMSWTREICESFDPVLATEREAAANFSARIQLVKTLLGDSRNLRRSTSFGMTQGLLEACTKLDQAVAVLPELIGKCSDTQSDELSRLASATIFAHGFNYLRLAQALPFAPAHSATRIAYLQRALSSLEQSVDLRDFGHEGHSLVEIYTGIVRAHAELARTIMMPIQQGDATGTPEDIIAPALYHFHEAQAAWDRAAELSGAGNFAPLRRTHDEVVALHGELQRVVTHGTSSNVILVSHALRKLLNSSQWGKSRILENILGTGQSVPGSGRALVHVHGAEFFGYAFAAVPLVGERMVQLLGESSARVAGYYFEERGIVKPGAELDLIIEVLNSQNRLGLQKGFYIVEVKSSLVATSVEHWKRFNAIDKVQQQLNRQEQVRAAFLNRGVPLPEVLLAFAGPLMEESPTLGNRTGLAWRDISLRLQFFTEVARPSKFPPLDVVRKLADEEHDLSKILLR